MPARLLLLGLDAAEPTVFPTPGSTGPFPALERLRREGAQGTLDSQVDLRGTHDRIGFASLPTEPRAARIVRRHGDYPIWAKGPGIPAATSLDGFRTTDIASIVFACLGLDASRPIGPQRPFSQWS